MTVHTRVIGGTPQPAAPPSKNKWWHFVERRLPILEKKIRGQDKEAKKAFDLVQRVLELLREGKPARLAVVAEDERATFKGLGLLTSKPVLYVANVGEDDLSGDSPMVQKLRERARAEGSEVVPISARLEAEIAELEQRAAADDEYLASRDGVLDRSARWQRHQLGRRIDKLRDQLAAVVAYIQPETVQ